MERIAQWGEKKPLGWPLPAPPEGEAASGGSATPAAPAAAPGAPAAEGEGPARAISHVVLYNYDIKPAVAGAAYEVIGQSSLPALLGGGGGGMGGPEGGGMGLRGGGGPPAPGMPPGMGMGGMGGGPPAPLAGGRGFGAGGGFGGTAWAPLGSEIIVPIGAGGATRPAGGMGDTSDTTVPAPAPTAAPPSRYKRTEFVILFIWREPTPSDTLLKAKPPPSEGVDGGFGGMGGPAPPAPPAGGMGGGMGGGGLNPRSSDI
jgi:hypothetical protein